ncbi:MAG: agmatinase [Chloroflexi bacterium]|nr:agmatinase [Chloroflexota bacterium]
MPLRFQGFYPPRNFGAIPPEAAEFSSARVVVLPVPYDSTTTYRGGARDGPAAIVDASQYVELFDPEFGRELYQVGIHLLDDVEPDLTSPAAMIDRVEAVTGELLDADKLVAMLGGEHSITVGAVRAHADRHADLSVLQIDAHGDLHDSFFGTPYSHACVMRRVLERCPAVQVGLRSLSREEWAFIQERELRPVFAEQAQAGDGWIDEVVARLSPTVYVTVDLDGLDPSTMAAVGTPEPGGLDWFQTLRLLRRVGRERRIVGFDVVELAPDQGPPACAYTAARLVYKLIGYALP